MANAWDTFAQLIAPAPLKIGTALTEYDDGTVLLQLPGTGQVRVLTLGIDIVTGAKYFYRGNKLESQAPDLNLVTGVEV